MIDSGTVQGSGRGVVPARARGMRTTAMLLLLAFLVSGCGTYATKSAKIKSALGSGNVELALGEVGEVDDNDVLGLLQRGLLLFYAGSYELSAQTFDRAYTRIDFLYGSNYAKEALSFLTNDAQRDYTGYPAEQILLHTYASLAYLADGDLDKALVEARRANTRLQVLEAVREDKRGYDDDAFAEWIAAMLFAEDGDMNPCLVSCRRALAAFDQYQELWGHAVPSAFIEDYTVWARRFGFGEEALELEARFGDIAILARAPLRGDGEVVLIYESGWVDHLEELRIDWPILESDKNDDDFARRVHHRGRRGHYVVHDDVKIKYWLSVAMPVLVHTGSALGDARLRSGDLVANTELVHDVSSIFRLTFEEGGTTRAIRTIARALVKAKLVSSVREGKKKKDGTREKNEAAGFLMNLFTSATERADTRSWTTLPDQIHLARLRLPEGDHRILVEVLRPGGAVAETATYESVHVVAGQRTLLHHRSYEATQLP